MFADTRLKQAARQIQATATAGPTTGTHRQLGHGANTGGGSFMNLAVSDPVADADVHGGWLGVSGWIGPHPFHPG